MTDNKRCYKYQLLSYLMKMKTKQIYLNNESVKLFEKKQKKKKRLKTDIHNLGNEY